MAQTIKTTDYEALVAKAAKPVVLEFGANW